jgi:hypothetical protein
MLALFDERRVGDLKPFEVAADLGETTNISGQVIRFYMRGIDLPGTRKIDGATATATDITAAEKLARRARDDAPPLSVWRLRYQPTSADVDTPGHYIAEFEVVYAASQSVFYPPGDEFIRIWVMAR